VDGPLIPHLGRRASHHDCPGVVAVGVECDNSWTVGAIDVECDTFWTVGATELDCDDSWTVGAGRCAGVAGVASEDGDV
jgi:hypothetical protein